MLFNLSLLDFCSEFVELSAACSTLITLSPFAAGWCSGGVAVSVGGETTTLCTGSLGALSDTIR